MLERGRYGVEWTPQKPRNPPVLGRVVVVVAFLALVSLAWTGINRIRTRLNESVAEPQPAEEPVAVAPEMPPPPAQVVTPPPAESHPKTVEHGKRSPKVRNLLMRLGEAEKKRDVEMAITTIEQLRSLPGSPVADLDDALARRLGVLNFHRLFTLKCAQWVGEVKVKRGDSASRIAAENGSTLASLAKLNGGKVDALRLGQTIYVLNHPRFALVVRRRMRTADLQLNGKFFKRYDLAQAVAGQDGSYDLAFPLRSFLKTVGVVLQPEDRAEIELLMPKGSTLIVSEM